MANPNQKHKLILFDYVCYAILTLSAAIVLYPLSISLEKSFDIGGWDNYRTVLDNINILRNLWNSIYVVGLTLAGTLIICSLAAFAFSKLVFKGKNILFLFLMMGMMIPSSAMLFPLFQIIRVFGMVNKPVSQVGPYITLNAIFGLLLLKLYYDGLPDEMMEAARIDGAGSFRVFLEVLLPVSLPGLSILLINTFLNAWNELQIAITFINKPEFYTIAAVPMYFNSSAVAKFYPGVSYACVIMCMIPIVVFYVAAQKLFINGMTAGSVKG